MLCPTRTGRDHASMPSLDAGHERSTQIHEFLRSTAARLADRVDDPAAHEGARRFVEANESSTPIPFEPGWLPALDTLHLVDDTPLGQHFVELAPLLPWSPTSRVADDGADFAFAELNLVRDLGDLTVGLMYVRPGRHYPLHSHPPHEVYLTLAGVAQWRYGGHDDLRMVGPDRTIYNHPSDLHSVTAGETPMVAIYVLWN